jgi:fermentation-respiration switch protein FrsA (DUF1100 family)
MGKTLFTLLLVPALAYALLAILLFFFQERMAYYPQMGRELRLNPRDYGLDHTELTLTTSDGERLDAWFVPAPGAGSVPGPVALILHGNAGNMTQRLDTIAMFHRLGYAVLIVDYRGYGRSTGRPSEQGLYRDALTAWEYLTRERGIAPARVVLFGESLGGGVAAWLAAQLEQSGQPGALVLASTFSSARELAADIYPWLPTRGLVRLRYDTRAALATISCPVFIAHSADDDIVPFRHGQRLYAAAGEPKAFLQMAGGHNQGFIYVLPAWVAALEEFLGRYVPV